MRTRILPVLFAVVFVTPAVAAPVPKGMKKVPPPPAADGVWRLTAVSVLGLPPEPRDALMRIDGEEMTVGVKALTDLPTAEKQRLALPSDDEPATRVYFGVAGGEYRSRVEVDGDTLRWAWRVDGKLPPACQPAAGTYTFEYRRVK